MTRDTTTGPGGEGPPTPVRRRASAWATVCASLFGASGGQGSPADRGGDIAADGGVEK